jgi:copper chaperone CopZ
VRNVLSAALLLFAIKDAAAVPQDAAPPAEDLRPVTFFVGGISCPSCAVPVQAGIAKVPGVTAIDLAVDEKYLRFRFDARRTSIQSLMKSFLGDQERYPSRLALRLDPPKADVEKIERVRAAVGAVDGVRAMSLPDPGGVVLITFHLDKSTLLRDILDAASKAGQPLGDVAPKKPAKRP